MADAGRAAGGPAADPYLSRWRRSGQVVPDLMAIALAVVALVGLADDRPWITILCATVLLVALVARLWSRLALAEVDYRIELSQARLVEGDAFELRLVAENRKPLPLPWLDIHDVVPAGLAIAGTDLGATRQTFIGGREVVERVAVGGYERVSLRVPLRAGRRGYYTFGPARLRSGDIFGFYETQREIRRRAPDLVVFPRPIDLPAFVVPAARPIGDVLARRPFAEDVSRPGGVREYRPGDPARRIDWKTTARRGTAFVRTFDPSVSHGVVVLCECRTSDAAAWSIDPDVLEDTVRVAAEVATRLLAEGHRVGLAINGNPLSGQYPPVVPPAAGPGQQRLLMASFAAASAITARPLEALLETHGPALLPVGATIVHVGGILLPETVAWLRRRAARGNRLVTLYTGRAAPPDPAAIDLRHLFGRGEAGPQETAGG